MAEDTPERVARKMDDLLDGLLRELEANKAEGSSAATGHGNQHPDQYSPGPDAKGQGRLTDNAPQDGLF